MSNALQYGIITTNKFGFLDEDEAGDLSELITQPTSKADKDAKKKDKKQQRKVKDAQPTSLPAVPPKAVPAKAGPKPAGVDLKQPVSDANKEDKENKPAMRPPNNLPPRRGGRGGAPGEQSGRGGGQFRGGGGPRRGGSGAQFQDNLPPRFAAGGDERVLNGGGAPRFEGEGGEYRGRGRGGEFRGRGMRRGGGDRGGRGRGGFDQSGGGEGGFGGFSEPINVSTGGDATTKIENWVNENDRRSGFDQTGAPEDGRAAFGTFGEEEGERASGARYPRGGGGGYGGGRGRGRGAGMGGGRGGGVGTRGGFDNRRRGQNDRQSGSDKTGVKPVEKREGGGAYNWGTTTDELAGETEPLNVTATDEPTGEVEHAEAKTGEEGANATAEPVAPEVLTLTLDEWKAKHEAEKKVPTFNIRKPGEGEDASVWTKLQPLKREPEEKKKKAEHPEEDEEYEEDDHRGKKKNDVTYKIDIKMSTEGQLGGGRGGGSSFGGGPRGRGGVDGGYGGGRGGGYGGGRGGPSPRRGGGPGFGRGGPGYRGAGGGGTGGRRDHVPSLDEDSFPQLPSAPAPVST